jgi:hypothetical protein
MSALSESALLEAVRDEIRGNAAFNNNQVQVEHDEMAPSYSGDLYIAVIPAGFRNGPTHHLSGHVNDFIYSVDVAVVMRAPKYPRDRRRDLFVKTTLSLNKHITTILDEVDFTYSVNATANATISSVEGSSYGFIEVLKLTSVDPRPKLVSGAMYGDNPNEARAGLARVIHLTGARRVWPL